MYVEQQKNFRNAVKNSVNIHVLEVSVAIIN